MAVGKVVSLSDHQRLRLEVALERVGQLLERFRIWLGGRYELSQQCVNLASYQAEKNRHLLLCCDIVRREVDSGSL